ncbi:MAG: type VI secretion system membrane subunit TssM [Myxococcales bacterium]|nr:type VI secretion system membrane subunit TssM [Myxococcales bacterium]
MWIYFLAAFLLALVWVAGYFLKLAFLTKVLASVAVGLLVVAVLVYRRMRAKRAARALERELLRQAEQQAMNARPDRRAEIAALQLQFTQGLASLKSSKLGGVKGAEALYALPWYMIIGPPGAGKTTALKASGLNFPFLDPRGGGIKGVGGTRNCDWWFTNEAILLDTAGRYTTEKDDYEEWLAFLDMLKRYRTKKPLNGVIVAISLTDLANANEEQVDEYAKKLRARVDEVMTRLEMIVPVYVMFTKTDLVGGFVEFFADLRKSERGQIWGASFSLGETLENAGRSTEVEIETLVKSLHARAVKRIGKERNDEARAKIYQFPLEFETLKQNLVDFVGGLFEKNTYSEPPIFRGFYFTSGTQEGRPMDRVLGSMARAFGLRPSETPKEATTESKSYFVTDFFKKIVFPDQDVAARTARELRRQRLRRLAYAAAAIGIALVLIVPSSCTFSRNMTLVDETKAMATDASKVVWSDPSPPEQKAKRLDALLGQLRKLDNWRAKGADLDMRWGMYVGERLYPSARSVYVAQLKVGFADPTRALLDGRLKSIDPASAQKGEAFNRSYDDLKVYLMMSDMELSHLDVGWVVPRLTKLWIAALRAPVSQPLEDNLKPHVEFYVELVKRGEIPPWKIDRTMVSRTRSSLLQVPQVDREYEALVRDANFEIAAIRFDQLFYGSVTPFVTSKKTTTVDGAYTKLGWLRVRELLTVKQDQLAAEKWVLGDNAKSNDEDIKKAVNNLRKLYFDRYQAAWHDFIASIEVQSPENSIKALDELSALSETEWPYLRLLRTLDENTRLELVAPKGTAGNVAEELLEKGKKQVEAKIDQTLGLNPQQGPEKPKGRPLSPVEVAFRPMTRFAVPENPPKEGDPPPSTGLAQYQAVLGKLIGLLTDLKDTKAMPDGKALAGELENAYRTTSALLAEQDGFTRPLLSPLLMRPIALAWQAIGKDVGGGQAGLWEPTVWKKWNTQLSTLYPFNPNSTTDASVQDFGEFFKPKDGVLWGFYEANLKGTLERQGDAFVPAVRFKSAIPYTPALLTCLKKSAAITAAAFPAKGPVEAPVVEFEINLHSVSEDISEVTFEIDGASKTYRNEPEQWLKVQWPAKEPTQRGGRIKVRGINQLDEEITRQGDFGMFRLLEAATIKPGLAHKPGAPVPLIATWELKAPKAYVRMELRPSRKEHPFDDTIFRTLTCPRVIIGAGTPLGK